MRAFKYVQGWVDDEGRPHQYFRRPGYPRIRLPGLPGSPEFLKAYELAMGTSAAPVGAKRSKPGTVAAAVASYLDSQLHFGSLAPTTQRMRRAILNSFRNKYGDYPMAPLHTKFITAVVSKKPPNAARNWLKAIRGLCQYAIAADMLKADPTQGIKLKIPKTDGFYSWPEEDITTYEANHAVGTKARLALALLLHTAQRKADVIRMGRQHMPKGVLSVRQNKTGTTLSIPVHPDLRAVIDATPGENLTFLVDDRGRPYTAESFGKQFRAWCDEAELPKACSAHGLRKAACRRLAEAGCSANEIAAISGHASLNEVARYTKAAEQARMAKNAMARTRTGT